MHELWTGAALFWAMDLVKAPNSQIQKDTMVDVALKGVGEEFDSYRGVATSFQGSASLAWPGVTFQSEQVWTWTSRIATRSKDATRGSWPYY